jgi:hypothetical protein
MPDKKRKLRTELTPAEEENFGKWYKEFAVKKNMNLNPDSSEHNADFRRIWLERSGKWESDKVQPSPGTKSLDLTEPKVAGLKRKLSNEEIINDEALEKRFTGRKK